MADLTRAQELIQAVDRDDAFRVELETAPTNEAKRNVLDAHGYQDIDLDDMKAYVESKGGTVTLTAGARELSEQELAEVARGWTEAEQAGIIIGATVGGAAAGVGIAVAAAGAA